MSLNHLYGLAPVSPCLSCTGEAKTGHSNPDASSSVLTRKKDHFPLSDEDAYSNAAQHAVLPLVFFWLFCYDSVKQTPSQLLFQQNLQGPSRQTLFPTSQLSDSTGHFCFSIKTIISLRKAMSLIRFDVLFVIPCWLFPFCLSCVRKCFPGEFSPSPFKGLRWGWPGFPESSFLYFFKIRKTVWGMKANYVVPRRCV